MPARVLRLISQLPEGSATSASIQGSRSARGWDHDRWLQRDMRQLMVIQLIVQLKAAGAKRIPKIPDWTTPKSAPVKPRARLADMPGAIDTANY